MSPLHNGTKHGNQRADDHGGACAPELSRCSGCISVVGGFPHSVCKEHRAQCCLNRESWMGFEKERSWGKRSRSTFPSLDIPIKQGRDPNFTQPLIQ